MELTDLRRKRLLALIGELDSGNVTAFSRRIGRSQSQVADMLAGRKSFGEKVARDIEQRLDLVRGWLDDPAGDEAARPGGNIATTPRPIQAWSDGDALLEDEVEVQRLTLKLSAGTGRLQWEIDDKGTPNRYRKAWCDRHGFAPAQLVTVQVDGDSMMPTLMDGGSVVINTADTKPRAGRIYAVDYRGEFYMKRLFLEPDGAIRVASDNPDKIRYPDWTVRPEHGDVLRVLGRAVQTQNDL